MDCICGGVFRGWGLWAAVAFGGLRRLLVAFGGLRWPSVAFGGPELRDLYVTSAQHTLEDGTKQGGQLFIVKETGAQGLPGRAFQPKAT